MNGLTAAQLLALKNDIAANQHVINVPGVGQVQIRNAGADGTAADAIAAWYNQIISTNVPLVGTAPEADFFGNYATVPVADIFNQIIWKNFTPTDAIPVGSNTLVDVNIGRCLVIQSQQINLGNMLTGRLTLDCTKANTVQGLKDSTNNVPAGANGANISGGWAGIQTVICRKATNLEKLLADTSGNTGADSSHAATFTFEGQITGTDVQKARGF